MIAATADVHERARVADSASVWHFAQVRENAVVGEQCTVGRGAYIDVGVLIGDNCKIQNSALIYSPAVLEDGVFIGPASVLTNDPYPRAVNSDGTLKDSTDWNPVGVLVRRGAAIGASSVILGGVEIGEWALVAAGSVVTKEVEAYALVVGSPARRVAWVGKSGLVLQRDGKDWVDPSDRTRYSEVEGKLSAQ